VSGSLGLGAVEVVVVVAAEGDVVEGAAVVDGSDVVVGVVADVLLVAPPAVEVLAAPPLGEPVEQDAVRVTARATAVTAASGRMSAECRSP
jgi:hypothetical protein